MTITYKINGVTLTNRVRLMEEGEGFVTAAERGAVGTGGVMIDDDDATLTINGWQSFTVDDDEAFPYSRVFTGFIVERNIGRNARYRTSTARVHDCSILDVNAYLHLHVLRANAAKRAAETDVARVAWLLTSEALSSLVYDRGLVSTANAGSYLESDTRRRFADDVMSELAPSAVKNFFVYQDNATATPGLFYDRDTSTAYSSTLRISNVASDVDNVVTFAPSIDATMQRQPNDQYGGVSYGWRGDPIYVQSATTIASMGILRDAVYDTDRVGLLATAQQTSKDWLNVRATEADFITVSLILPSARINDIYAGQRIQVKFSHIPGYSSFTYTRVRRRAVKPVAPQFWEMRLELWVPAVPVSDAADGGLVAWKYLEGATGHSSGFEASAYDDSLWATGNQPFGKNDLGGTQVIATAWVGANDDLCLRTHLDLSARVTAVTLTVHIDYSGSVYWNGSLVGTADYTTSTTDGVVPGVAIVLGSWSVGDNVIAVRAHADATQHRFELRATVVEPPAPKPLGLVSESLGYGNGTKTAWTTTWPFDDGSLTVFVDRLDQTAAATITSAAAGTFTLAFAALSSELVEVTYRGR